MNAMEKAAWTELAVCTAAVVVVTMLFPWLGARASGGFALLGLIVLGLLFTRRRGNRTVVDERDREIERRATSVAVGTTWMALCGVLALATTWSSYTGAHAVSTVLLNWLIWVQFAMFFATKAVASVLMYRRRQHAA